MDKNLARAFSALGPGLAVVKSNLCAPEPLQLKSFQTPYIINFHRKQISKAEHDKKCQKLFQAGLFLVFQHKCQSPSGNL